MIGFILGCVVGGTVGVVALCCCIAGQEADKHIDSDE